MRDSRVSASRFYSYVDREVSQPSASLLFDGAASIGLDISVPPEGELSDNVRLAIAAFLRLKAEPAFAAGMLAWLAGHELELDALLKDTSEASANPSVGTRFDL
jgi:hypothetical protein